MRWRRFDYGEEEEGRKEGFRGAGTFPMRGGWDGGQREGIILHCSIRVGLRRNTRS